MKISIILLFYVKATFPAFIQYIVTEKITPTHESREISELHLQVEGIQTTFLFTLNLLKAGFH